MFSYALESNLHTECDVLGSREPVAGGTGNTLLRIRSAFGGRTESQKVVTLDKDAELIHMHLVKSLFRKSISESYVPQAEEGVIVEILVRECILCIPVESRKGCSGILRSPGIGEGIRVERETLTVVHHL